MTNFPATLLCDFYKISHRQQYPKNTQYIYSTFTPRSNKYFTETNGAVVFGIQSFIKKYLVKYFNENFFEREKNEVVEEYKRLIANTLGGDVDTSHIESLHDLGYLPIKICALKEGTFSPIKVPVLTIENTHPDFFWLTNYLETLMSNEIWLPMTSATTAYQYRRVLDEYALLTTGSTVGVGFQGHDFSMRGMASLDASASSGAGHLLSFTGSDTIPSILYLEEYYNANVEKELVATSIPATEHSVMCSYGNENEFDLFKNLITKTYPNGFVSIVSDTWDFWKVVGEYLPKLKEVILSRDGKIVIRPDSGNPIDIICGTANVQDMNSYETFEDAKEIFAEFLVDEVRENTEHGEYGESSPEGYFKFEEKIYFMELEIDWNRYDKQYYYIDGSKISECVEVELTFEQKGLIESLWDIFGGAITEQNYKVLDAHIGAIYGDSITLERAKQIVEKLEQKGFASTNIVFGIGSYTYQMKSRDSLGFAMKATHAIVDGEERMLFKDPKTDDGTKRSQRGRVWVYQTDEGIQYADGLNSGESVAYPNLLETVFCDGKLIRDESLSEIRGRLELQK